MRRKPSFTIAILFILIAGGFKQPEPAGNLFTDNRSGNTILQFKNLVGTKELKLFEETYINPFGEPFVVSKFKYYISHIVLTVAGNKEVDLPNNYYLVNEEDAVSKIIQLPAVGISDISVTIGVDSIRNVSGVQTGALDPMNAMFWTWNSGYVFAKLEGQSDSSHAPAHSFSWHVGGFRQQENAIKRISLSINAKNSTTSDTITLYANVLKWFDGKQPLKITQAPVCHQPGKLAMQIADNYSTMFSVAP